MAVVVENLPADADTRLRKQLRDLLSHGYRVSVITRPELLRRYFLPRAGAMGTVRRSADHGRESGTKIDARVAFETRL